MTYLLTTLIAAGCFYLGRRYEARVAEQRRVRNVRAALQLDTLVKRSELGLPLRKAA